MAELSNLQEHTRQLRGDIKADTVRTQGGVFENGQASRRRPVFSSQSISGFLLEKAPHPLCTNPRHDNPFLVRLILKTVGGVDGEVRDLFFSATFEDRHDDAGETAGPGHPRAKSTPMQRLYAKAAVVEPAEIQRKGEQADHYVPQHKQ
jgi:hypothetical protein